MLVFYISNAFVHYAFLPQAANEVGIATIHSIFNIAATIVLLPLSGFPKLRLLLLYFFELTGPKVFSKIAFSSFSSS